MARRHPDGKWLKRVADVESLTKEQDRLLEALWSTLKAGGKLLYATCSVFRQENEARIQAFLARHGDARLERLNLPGAIDGQWLPDSVHDGFFYAAWSRRKFCVAVLGLALATVAVPGWAEGILAKHIELQPRDEHMVLSGGFEVQLNDKLEEALKRGVTITAVAHREERAQESAQARARFPEEEPR